MEKGELYDEELLARHLKGKGLLDDEALARAKRVRARLFEFELPRALDRVLFDLRLVGAEELQEAVKASRITDAPTEHIPAAIMAGHAAKARTEVRERLDKMRRALEHPKKAAEHGEAEKALPPAGIVAVCGAVTAVAVAVLVVRLLPPELPETDPRGKPRSFEPYAVENDLDDLLGRVGFMPASPRSIFVERPDGRMVELELARVRKGAQRYAASAEDSAQALAALRTGIALTRSAHERARLLLAAAKRAEGGLAVKLLRKLREDCDEEQFVGESHIIEGGKASDAAAACRAYRTYLRRYPEGEFAEQARVGLVEAGSSPTRLPQPEETPVWPGGSKVLLTEPFEELPGPGVYGRRIEEGMDPGPNRIVLAAIAEPGEGPLRAFVVLGDKRQVSPNSQLAFRAWAKAREGCLVEVSVLALGAEEHRWLGFRLELGPRWKTLRLPLGKVDGLRIHSVSFVAPAKARNLYIDDLTLYEPPR